MPLCKAQLAFQLDAEEMAGTKANISLSTYGGPFAVAGKTNFMCAYAEETISHLANVQYVLYSLC